MNGKLQKTIEYLSKFPGVGPRHATRIALELMKWNKTDLNDLADTILTLKEGLKTCALCHYLTDENLCYICKNQKRNQETICVVEKITDLESIEKTGVYGGIYHVLGGAIDPLEKILPKNLNMDSLFQRIQKYPSDKIEIIIATNPNTAGETTALYIEEKLKPFNIKTTRLGRGLSSGTYLEYADELTLNNAFKNRK